MRKKMKKALGVILGATVMMAVAGCGQSNSSGGQSTQEAKTESSKAEETKAEESKPEEEATGTIEMWSMLTQRRAGADESKACRTSGGRRRGSKKTERKRSRSCSSKEEQ